MEKRQLVSREYFLRYYVRVRMFGLRKVEDGREVVQSSHVLKEGRGRSEERV